MKILLVFSMLLSFMGVDDNVSSIKLERKYKVERTFSGNTSFDESFHLILAKNIEEKQMEIIPIVNTSGNLSRLTPVVFDDMPKIQSFHNKGNVVSLVLGLKDKKEDIFVVVDIDLKTGKSTKSEVIPGKDFKSIIRKEDKNIMVFSNKRRFNVMEIQSATNIKNTKVEVKENMWPLLEDLDSSTLEAVNTDEFVANGSIKEFKCYYEDGTVYVTQEVYDKGFTAVAEVSLKDDADGLMKIRTFTVGQKSKKLASYIGSGKLFQLKADKENGEFNIYNLKNGSPTNISLSFVQPSRKAQGFTDMEDFLKKASKGKYAPTVAVNQTDRGNLLVRFDYVLKNTYGYHYNWWWHHHMWMHQHMMMQQQLRANIPSSFGPSIPNFDMLPLEAKGHYFEVVLDVNSNIINSNEDAVYSFIDKKKHIREVEQDTRIKDASTMFLEDEMRYFGYESKSKSFKVISKRIHD